MLPPPGDTASEPPAAVATPLPRASNHERWSVRVELQDNDVAKLYGQGLARGALVWKRGMREWRPLLIVPELTSLLRRTRIAVAELGRPEVADEVTEPKLPKPSLLPTGVVIDYDASGRRVPITVSPTAADITPSGARAPRRHFETIAAALGGFALAWFVLAGKPGPSSAEAPIAAAQPVPDMVPRAVLPPPAVTAASTIPLVALADLPVVGAKGATPDTVAASARGGRSNAARASVHGDGPSRSDLMAALARVAGSAGGCGERGGPVRVVVTFGASGVARGIQVSGKDLPSSTRSCIIGAASRARVPAFTGEPVTVSKTL